MINFISPRIHNLGDFANCLPALSGVYKELREPINFIICDRLERFKGIKELLLAQDMFEKVSFVHEIREPIRAILIDDNGEDDLTTINPLSTVRYANSIKKIIDFKIDESFELQVPKLDIDYHNDKILVGDRWSPKDAPDVDDRRSSNLIESSGILKDLPVLYLDYTKDLVYNCSLIKYNINPFVTTFTGIGILADLMNKDQYIVWGEDVRNWNNKSIEYSFRMHYYENRKSKLTYINDIDTNILYENLKLQK